MNKARHGRLFKAGHAAIKGMKKPVKPDRSGKSRFGRY